MEMDQVQMGKVTLRYTDYKTKYGNSKHSTE